MTVRPASQRVLLFTQEDPLVLASGEVVPEVEVAFETYGTLSPDGSNAVFVCHALTGDAHAADWWAQMVGPGKPVDTDRFFVISPNLLGGCRGTTGPRSTDPRTGELYGLDFPQLDMADFVTVHRRLIAHLGVTRLYAAIGGSMGGMQVLQWAFQAPGEVERAVIIAASSRLTAINIALSHVARSAILSDPDLGDGRYADGAGPRRGLATARMLGHVTYLSEDVLEERFGHELQHDGPPHRDFGVDFAIESYLEHQGQSFLDRFDALTYLYLSRVMDYFDPFAEPVTVGDTRFLLVSFDSDWRFSPEQSERMRASLEVLGVEVRHEVISSIHGHDSFLMDVPGYQEAVSDFLR